MILKYYKILIVNSNDKIRGSEQVPLRYRLLGLLNDGHTTRYELDKVFKAALYSSWHVQTI